MAALADFYATHPLWTWLIVAGVILIAELLTGSGWLLWPTASAAVVAVIAPLLGLGWAVDVTIFAVLTIASTLAARKFLPDGRLRPGPDINDRSHDLVGKHGQIISAFVDGRGRVLVDGAEWEAEIEGDAPTVGSVEVVSVLGGARIRVRAV